MKDSPLAVALKEATKFLASLPIIEGCAIVCLHPIPGITDAELDQWLSLDAAIAKAAMAAGFPITGGPDAGCGFTKLVITSMRAKWKGEFRRGVFADEWLERMKPWLAFGDVAPKTPDGPLSPDGFRFEGKEYRGIQPLPWLFLNYLWSQPDRAADIYDAVDAVNGESFFTREPQDWSTKLNTFFRKKKLPFRSTVKGKARQAAIIDDVRNTPKKRKNGV